MPLSPYLSFAGNCADAIAYYQQTLGAELFYKLSFGEMPPSAADNEMDWQETFRAQGFGKVSDRFGVPWMINVVKQQPAT